MSLWGLVLCGLSLWRWIMQDVAAESFRIQQINGLLGVNVFDLEWPHLRNGYPFGHQNYLAGVVLLLIPFWLAQIRSAIRWVRLASFGAIILGIATLWTTQTRAAAPALGVMLVLLLAWTAVRRTWSLREWSRWLIVGSAIIAALAAANPRTRRMIDEGTGATQAWQSDVRSQMLAAGRLLLRGHAWTGIGPGAVPSQYPAVRGAIDAGLEANYQLHNTPLQVAVETGILGLGATLLLLGATALRWWRIPLVEDSETVPLPVWAGIAAMGYAAYSITDYQLDTTTVWCLLGLSIGLVWSGGPTAKTPSRPASSVLARSAAAAVALLLLASLGASLWVGRARWHFHQAVTALDQGDPAGFATLTERAHREDPANPFYPEKLAAWHVEWLAASTNADQRAEHASAAKRWLETSLAARTNSEYALFNLGWLTLESDPASALAHFQQAAHLVPDRKGVYLGCAAALARLDRPAQAADALALELVLDPGFLATTSPWRKEPLAHLKSAAVQRSGEFLAQASDELGSNTETGRWLRQKAATITWLAGGPVPPPERREFLPGFWQSIAGTTSPSPASISESPAWRLVYAAWESTSPDAAKRFLLAAGYRSTRTVATEARLDTWLRRLKIGSWSDVVRHEPAWELLSGYRRQRSGYNLIARHSEGARPADIPTYEENTFYETFFSFIAGNKSDVPSPMMLRELDRIVASKPAE